MSSKTVWLVAAIALANAGLGPGAALGQGIRKERVAFEPGASSAVIKGSIRGEEIVDYLVGARTGQTMHVEFAPTSTSAYFNVLPPGSEEAIFIGSTSGNRFTGALPADGDYIVRVYLMRSAARRNVRTTYTLTVGLGSGPAGKAPAGDRRVPGTAFHATGDVPCWLGTRPAGSSQCRFGAVRGAPGNADVYLTAPRGAARVLKFRGSTVTTTDPNIRVKSEKRGDEWHIKVNDVEHYVIPEAVVLGG